jgi:enoyl-CoA hydratase
MGDGEGAPAPMVHHEVDARPEGAVHRIVLAHERRLNCLDSAQIDRLRVAFEAVSADDEARVVVLTGAGERAFVGGADVREMAVLEPARAESFIRGLHGACAAARAVPVPVIARIDGWCLGAGLELAAACDLRLASDRSRFGMPEVQIGLPSVIEAALLPALVGMGRARDLVYTGRVIDAAEALAWGLIDAAVAPEALDSLVETRLGEILAAGPRAIRLQKRVCRAWEQLDVDEAIEASIAVFREAYATDEPARAMRRFLERKRG